jgi:hypothetical protein
MSYIAYSSTGVCDPSWWSYRLVSSNHYANAFYKLVCMLWVIVASRRMYYKNTIYVLVMSNILNISLAKSCFSQLKDCTLKIQYYTRTLAFSRDFSQLKNCILKIQCYAYSLKKSMYIHSHTGSCQLKSIHMPCGACFNYGDFVGGDIKTPSDSKLYIVFF